MKKFEELLQENAALKEQLEKQKPEIPQFVAEWIEHAKRNKFSISFAVRTDNIHMPQKVHEWIDNPKDFSGQEIIALAWINGYTVAKEKRFYLKSKQLLISDDGYREPDVDELYLDVTGDFVIYKYNAKQFTQKEIDRMDTGSYEQIPVEKEDDNGTL